MAHLFVLVFSVYLIGSAIFILWQIALSLIALPLALAKDTMRELRGEKTETELVLERAHAAQAAAEKIENEIYEQRYFSKNPPDDVDENGIPYL